MERTVTSFCPNRTLWVDEQLPDAGRLVPVASRASSSASVDRVGAVPVMGSGRHIGPGTRAFAELVVVDRSGDDLCGDVAEPPVVAAGVVTHQLEGSVH